MTKDQILKLMIKGCLVEAGEDGFEIELQTDKIFHRMDPNIDLTNYTVAEFKNLCEPYAVSSSK
jgi:hypothetical protein